MILSDGTNDLYEISPGEIVLRAAAVSVGTDQIMYFTALNVGELTITVFGSTT